MASVTNENPTDALSFVNDIPFGWNDARHEFAAVDHVPADLPMPATTRESIGCHEPPAALKFCGTCVTFTVSEPSGLANTERNWSRFAGSSRERAASKPVCGPASLRAPVPAAGPGSCTTPAPSTHPPSSTDPEASTATPRETSPRPAPSRPGHTAPVSPPHPDDPATAPASPTPTDDSPTHRSTPPSAASPLAMRRRAPSGGVARPPTPAGQRQPRTPLSRPSAC